MLFCAAAAFLSVMSAGRGHSKRTRESHRDHARDRRPNVVHAIESSLPPSPPTSSSRVLVYAPRLERALIRKKNPYVHAQGNNLENGTPTAKISAFLHNLYNNFVLISGVHQVIEFCAHYKEDPMNEIEKPLKSANMHDVVQEWYAKFVEVQQETLFELILAANYMDIKPLLDLTCATVASMIKVCVCVVLSSYTKWIGGHHCRMCVASPGLHTEKVNTGNCFFMRQRKRRLLVRRAETHLASCLCTCWILSTCEWEKTGALAHENVPRGMG